MDLILEVAGRCRRCTAAVAWWVRRQDSDTGEVTVECRRLHHPDRACDAMLALSREEVPLPLRRLIPGQA